jgi:hypothetical protein
MAASGPCDRARRRQPHRVCPKYACDLLHCLCRTSTGRSRYACPCATAAERVAQLVLQFLKRQLHVLHFLTRDLLSSELSLSVTDPSRLGAATTAHRLRRACEVAAASDARCARVQSRRFVPAHSTRWHVRLLVDTIALRLAPSVACAAPPRAPPRRARASCCSGQPSVLRSTRSA